MSLAFWTIAKRELKSLFVSPVAYVVLGIFAFLTGYFFIFSLGQFDLNLKNAQLQAQLMKNPDILNYININSFLINRVTSFTFMLLLFAAPFLTMRMLTEERANSTYELLLTSPISIWDIVFGKFVAGALFLVSLIGTHILFLAVMFGFGNPEIGPVISSYLGLYLAALAFVAIGLFASSLTKHQIISFIVALAVNLSLLMVSWAAQSASGNLSTVLQKAAITTHFEHFNQGIIYVSSVVYFLTIVVLFLAATQISIRSLARN